MKLTDFLQEIKTNCSEITYLSIKHMLAKLYDIDKDSVDKTILLQNIQDYPMFLRYLNDYAGVIYRKYNSSTDDIYQEICEYFGMDIDNIYTCRYNITKLFKQTPDMIMSLDDKESKLKVINKFEKILTKIKSSNYYQKHLEELQKDILILEKNISLVKKAFFV